MAGRNNRPKNRGPASSPSSLEQFGDNASPSPRGKAHRQANDRA
ncbi:hypothetical protein [Paenibacillus sp. 1001270B_150601_E10]|nr:hypothetical protein [Paenibacillus sp. 1001270B_150601_E10]